MICWSLRKKKECLLCNVYFNTKSLSRHEQVCVWEKYFSKRSLIKHTCSWRDKFIVLWTLNRQAKIFLHITFILSEVNFFKYFCFISMHVVLNKLSEYKYFYISKNITLYTFLLVFKMVESLQCILKSSFILNVTDEIWASSKILDIS